MNASAHVLLMQLQKARADNEVLRGLVDDYRKVLNHALGQSACLIENAVTFLEAEDADERAALAKELNAKLVRDGCEVPG